jgi:hypothetical protein
MILLYHYMVWHYTRGVADYLSVWKTFLWFVPHFFSILTLLKTLFSPWHRLKESYSGKFSLEAFGETIILNTIMRFVGLFVRLITIVLGIFVEAVVFAGGVALFFVWLTAPVLIPLLFVIGVTFLFIPA